MGETSEGQPKFLRAAIYTGTGTWEESIVAVDNMFEWMGIPIEQLDENAINAGALDDFDIFLVPGNDMCQYDQEGYSSPPKPALWKRFAKNCLS